jgi:hypothetical protein
MSKDSGPTELLAGPWGCPLGTYCPPPGGARAPLPCPNNSRASVARAAQCVPAPGFWGFPDVQPCAPGSYCQSGASVPCPAGSFCPARSASPAPCPAGWYCHASSPTPIICPPGAYCPPNSAAPTPCPTAPPSTSAGARSPDECGEWVKYPGYVLTTVVDSWANPAWSMHGTNNPNGGRNPDAACYAGVCGWTLDSAAGATAYSHLGGVWNVVPKPIPGVPNMAAAINPGGASPTAADYARWAENVKLVPQVMGFAYGGTTLHIFSKPGDIWNNKVYLKSQPGWTAYVRSGSPMEGRFSPLPGTPVPNAGLRFVWDFPGSLQWTKGVDAGYPDGDESVGLRNALSVPGVSAVGHLPHRRIDIYVSLKNTRGETNSLHRKPGWTAYVVDPGIDARTVAAAPPSSFSSFSCSQTGQTAARPGRFVPNTGLRFIWNFAGSEQWEKGKTPNYPAGDDAVGLKNAFNFPGVKAVGHSPGNRIDVYVSLKDKWGTTNGLQKQPGWNSYVLDPAIDTKTIFEFSPWF